MWYIFLSLLLFVGNAILAIDYDEYCLGYEDEFGEVSSTYRPALQAINDYQQVLEVRIVSRGVDVQEVHEVRNYVKSNETCRYEFLPALLYTYKASASPWYFEAWFVPIRIISSYPVEYTFRQVSTGYTYSITSRDVQVGQANLDDGIYSLFFTNNEDGEYRALSVTNENVTVRAASMILKHFRFTQPLSRAPTYAPTRAPTVAPTTRSPTQVPTQLVITPSPSLSPTAKATRGPTVDMSPITNSRAPTFNSDTVDTPTLFTGGASPPGPTSAVILSVVPLLLALR